MAPTMPVCFLCQKEKGEIALLGAAWKGDREPPMKMCMDKEPCDQCKALMKRGIILISVRNGKQDPDNPYRTGAWVVIKEEAAAKIFTDPMVFQVRAAFIEDELWDKLHLPRGGA